MKLLLRRDQRSSVMGNAVFSLEVRADITAQERAHINRYKLGKTVLYSRDIIVDPGRGFIGFASRLAFKAMNISVTVDDLDAGKRIECNNIQEIVAVEGTIRESLRNFMLKLNTAAHFGGEHIIDI